MSTVYDPYVTIVSGLPRSGTSMMMRMIETGGIPSLVDNIRAADVDNPKGYYEFEPVKKTKKDPSWLATATGKVVKMVYVLLYDLPSDYQYRVVFMNRRLEEVLESQDVMLERRGKSAGAKSHQDLKATFQAQLDKMYAWLDGQANFQVLRVDYNEVLGDAQSPVDAVNAFLGGTLDAAAMRDVVDQSLYRRRK